ncbi:hypothetical protein F0L74_23410 [Chitinophaga agrisoli]|uniref:Uncharacterized protein n=1 Tax=Chitinophaga agrisoli TaxID=2607653 RepID=A0A5B2VLL1_9BACT|nr:hypothetical protein [Chitinophaga agrisoli]KAA2239157.1 hypothetical protein F0L74_23410 [Chitinophaga agrisoli]
MENNQTYISELSEKVLKGVEKAIRKLVHENAALDKMMVIKDEDGNIKHVPAKDLLKNLPPQ